MSLTYSWPCSMQKSEQKTYILPCTQAASTVTFTNASKGLFLHNRGSNEVFVEFDGDVPSVNSFSIPADGKLDLEHAQVDAVSGICASGESADLRILVVY